MVLAGLLAVVLAGCGAPGGEDTASPTDASATPAAGGEIATALADTEWRLVEIRSMSEGDAARPDDRSKYTMRLNRDGTVAMRLNCNTARGTWRSQPTADGLSGRLELGTLATTEALCPPPSLDQRIAASAPYVRSYLVRDGRLSLSLTADGGIYVWEPSDIEEPFLTAPDPALETAILNAAPDYTRQRAKTPSGGASARYVYGRVDLNGDGAAEVFAYLLGPFFCGTGGCDLMLFTAAHGAYTPIATFPTSRQPVIVSPTTTNGWKDLLRLESDDGAAGAAYVRHTFNGATYVEAGRRLAGPVPPEGKRLLAGALSATVGVPLGTAAMSGS